MSNEFPPAGGWTLPRELSPDDTNVFDFATKNLMGVGYSPLLVKSQVVAGINYRFLCLARGVFPDAPPYAVVVCILAPAVGEPHITEIIQIF